MSKLYAEESIVICVEAGRTAAQHAMEGNFDVHFRDASLKCGLEANALASPHVDETEVPKMSMSDDPKVAGKEMLRMVDEIESKLKSQKAPKGKSTKKTEAEALDPATLLMLWQLGMQAMNLFRSWWKW